jgi:hypothetical protein
MVIGIVESLSSPMAVPQATTTVSPLGMALLAVGRLRVGGPTESGRGWPGQPNAYHFIRPSKYATR